METPREKRLRHKIRCHQIQIKEKNKAERRLLTRKIERLDIGTKKAMETIDHQMKNLSHQMHEQDIVNEDNAAMESRLEIRSDIPMLYQGKRNSRIISPQLQHFDPRSKSAPPEVLSRSTSGLPRVTSAKSFHVRWRPVVEKSKPKCRFDTWGNNCGNFPCHSLDNYTPIGFDVQPNGHKSAVFKTGLQRYARARESLILDLESTSVRRPLRTSNDQTARKIVSLKKIIEEMKVKSDENRPKDWCTNYGKPISKRKLLKVARPNSIDVFQGI